MKTGKRRHPRPLLSDPEETKIFAPDPDPDEETLDGIVNQFGPGDVQIKVYKLESGTRAYCGYLTNPADVNEESVRAMGFGPGKYVLHVLINGAFAKAIPIAIAAPVGPIGLAEQPDSGLKLVADRLAQVVERLSNPQVEREPINALADAMLKLQQLNPPKSAELPLETIMKCIELGKTLNPDAKSDDTLTSIVKEAMPALSQMFAASRAQPPQQQQLPVGGTVQVDPREQQVQQLKAGIAFLKRKCIAGADPLLYLDLIVDNREEALYGTLIHSVLTQDFSSFAQVDSEIDTEPFRPFFRAIYDGLRSAFTAPDTVAVSTGGSHGNKKDAPRDVTPSANGSKRK